MNRHKNTEYNAVMIDTSVLHDGIKYGISRTFIKNNYLKMHGKPMIRKSIRRKQKYVTGLFRFRH